MAKGYREWVQRDVEVEKPAAPLTGKAYWKNWWYYNKWIVLAAVVGLVMAAWLIRDILGIGVIQPDVRIAYVGSTELPNSAVEALTAGLETICPDLNGDGTVRVAVSQYVLNQEGAADAFYAAQTRLAADLEAAESYFFLLEDPETFQLWFQILATPAGECPDDEDYSAGDKVLLWADCSVLAGLPLGDYSGEVLGIPYGGSVQELLGGLYLGRRCFYAGNPHRPANVEGCAALWQQWTGWPA